MRFWQQKNTMKAEWVVDYIMKKIEILYKEDQ